MNEYRCSSLARYSACPGSRAAENAAVFSDEDSPEAASGRLVHEVLALWASRGFCNINDACKVKFVDEDSREYIVCCWFAKIIGELIESHGGSQLVVVEQRIIEQFGSANVSGQPDLIVWCGDGSIHVIDYKSGYGEQVPAWANAQLAGYVSLFAIRHGVPEGSKVYAHIVSAGSVVPKTTTEYGADEIQQSIDWLASVVDGCESSGAGRFVGDHCKYCKANGSPILCPESCNNQFDASSLPAEVVSAEVAARVVELYDVAVVAESNIKAFKEWIKEKLSAGVDIPGLSLSEGSSQRTVDDPGVFFQAGLNRGYWDASSFLSAVSVSIPSAEKIAKESKGLKGKAWSAEWENGIGSLISTKSRAPSIKRSRE
jgi:hypothetical protein